MWHHPGGNRTSFNFREQTLVIIGHANKIERKRQEHTDRIVQCVDILTGIYRSLLHTEDTNARRLMEHEFLFWRDQGKAARRRLWIVNQGKSEFGPDEAAKAAIGEVCVRNGGTAFTDKANLNTLVESIKAQFRTTE